VTWLGTSHGFDHEGNCTGYIIWVNHRGIIVDPPPQSGHMLTELGISNRLIDALIITHCHAGHDAGTFQYLLNEGIKSVMTTRTIMGSFLRKYSAISGKSVEFLRKLFMYRPVTVGTLVKIHGADLVFHYSLHTIPTVGLRVRLLHTFHGVLSLSLLSLCCLSHEPLFLNSVSHFSILYPTLTQSL
jgi:glyoxylase-like metal-dependent hydrolase (beta-lactamase superfamily II)